MATRIIPSRRPGPGAVQADRDRTLRHLSPAERGPRLPLRVCTTHPGLLWLRGLSHHDDLVPALSRLIETGRYGIYHLPNEGRASRYEFARHILGCYGYADYPITTTWSRRCPG